MAGTLSHQVHNNQYFDPARCRICNGVHPEHQCAACAFRYCRADMMPDLKYCLRAGCVSTFQNAHKQGQAEYLKYVRARTPEEFGITHRIVFIDVSAAPDPNAAHGPAN